MAVHTAIKERVDHYSFSQPFINKSSFANVKASTLHIQPITQWEQHEKHVYE